MGMVCHFRLSMSGGDIVVLCVERILVGVVCNHGDGDKRSISEIFVFVRRENRQGHVTTCILSFLRRCCDECTAAIQL